MGWAFADPARPRFVEVRGDSFEPIVRRGDYVLVAPVERWSGDADYVVERLAGDFELYRCSATGPREKPIRMHRPNPVYRQDRFMSRTAFEAAVAGIIVGFFNVTQPALLRDFMPC